VNGLNCHEVDPQANLADVMERLVSGRTKSHQLTGLLASNWKAARECTAGAAA
jgi:transposase